MSLPSLRATLQVVTDKVFCFRRLRFEATLHRSRGNSRSRHRSFNHDSSSTFRQFFFLSITCFWRALLTSLSRCTQAINVAVLSVPDFKSVQTVFTETRQHLGEILSAFEFFDQEGLDMVLEHTGAKTPFESEPEGGRAFYVLIETSGSNKDHDDEVSLILFPLASFERSLS